MKRLLLWTLVLALLLPAFAGFAEEKPLEFTLMIRRSENEGNFEDMYIFDVIQEKFNVKINFNVVDFASFEEKKSLAFNLDELPDFFVSGLSATDISTYGAQGLLMDLSDLLEEYAPNIQKVWELYPQDKAGVTELDGSIYSVGNISKNSFPTGFGYLYLNYQWLENLGLEVPTTLEEMYNVLVAFRDLDADGDGDPTNEIPIGACWSDHFDYYGVYDSSEMLLLVPFGFVNSRIDMMGTDTVNFVPLHDNYLPYLKCYNKFWNEGLFDQDLFTQTEEQFLAKGDTGVYGMFTYWYEYLVVTNQEMCDNYWCFPPITSEYNQQQIWPGQQGANRNANISFAIAHDCEHPEVLVQILDWFYSDEGTTAYMYGPEAGTWDKSPGGWKWTTNEAGITYREKVSDDRFTDWYELNLQMFNPIHLPYAKTSLWNDPETGEIDKSDPGWRWSVNQKTYISPYIRYYYPNGVKFTEEENEELSLLKTDINAFCAQMDVKFITGELPFDQFEEVYVQGLKDRNVDRYIEILQTGYDRWKAAQ